MFPSSKVVRNFRRCFAGNVENTSPGPRFSARFVTKAGLAFLLCLAVWLRVILWPFQSADFTFYFLPWYDVITQKGFAAFRDEFSDYNPPYLFLMYFVSLTGVKAIDAVKMIGFGGDLLLAFSVMRVIKAGSSLRYLPELAAMATLFLPGVFLNSAMWGQCDVIYTAFLLLSFAELQSRRFMAVWACWSIALIFKLQAIFFLPFLGFMWATDRRCPLVAPALVIPIFLAPLVPVWIAGRSWVSLLTIYTGQAGKHYEHLTWGAPTLYRWIPDQLINYFEAVGAVFALSVVSLTLLAFFVYRSVMAPKQHLVFAAFLLLLVPFLLPEMHERYFIAAEIFTFTLAVQWPRYAIVAVLLQLNVLFSYMPYLGAGKAPVPPGVMALAMLAAICFLARDLITAPVGTVPTAATGGLLSDRCNAESV